MSTERRIGPVMLDQQGGHVTGAEKGSVRALENLVRVMGPNQVSP